MNAPLDRLKPFSEATLDASGSAIRVNGRLVGLKETYVSLHATFQSIVNRSAGIHERLGALQVHHHSTQYVASLFSGFSRGLSLGKSIQRLSEECLGALERHKKIKELIVLHQAEIERKVRTRYSLLCHTCYVGLNKSPLSFVAMGGAFRSESLTHLIRELTKYCQETRTEVGSVIEELVTAKELMLEVEALLSSSEEVVEGSCESWMNFVLTQAAHAIAHRIWEKERQGWQEGKAKLMIPMACNLSRSSLKHFVFLEIGQEKSGKALYLKLIDPDYHSYLDPSEDKKCREMIFSGCQANDFGVKFWKGLLYFDVTDWYRKDMLQNFYQRLQQLLKDRPVVRGREYSLQGNLPSCSVKGLMIWLHSRVSDHDLRGFRSFHLARLIERLKRFAHSDLKKALPRNLRVSYADAAGETPIPRSLIVPTLLKHLDETLRRRKMRWFRVK